MASERERNKQDDRDERRPGEESMTEKGLGGDDREREKAREERGREHDMARRQTPINR